MSKASPGPTITVLTPTYNRANFLPETVESVLSQDYPYFDYLVLDDGSVDDTPDILVGYAQEEPARLRCVRHDNLGQARTLNRGFGLATGDFLCIVNSEDPLLPGALARLAAELEAKPSVVAVYPDTRVIDADGNTEVDLLYPQWSLVDFFRFQLGPGAGIVFSRRVATEIGGWNPAYRIAPDLEFFLRAALHGPFAHVPEVLATWRRHSGAITVASVGAPSIEERFRLLEEFLSRPDLPADLRSRSAEAYRNLHIIAGLTQMPDFNQPDDRFVIFDRIGWATSSHTVGHSLEADLLHFQNATEVLQREVAWRDCELAECRRTIADLESELASRSRLLDEFRDQLAP